VWCEVEGWLLRLELKDEEDALVAALPIELVGCCGGCGKNRPGFVIIEPVRGGSDGKLSEKGGKGAGG
jgi:hypothetical protein